MTAKEYLSQARTIDQRLNSKLEQAKSLRSLAEIATTALSLTPHSGTRNVSEREGIIVRMLDLESGISADINELMDIRQEIMEIIQRVPVVEHRTLLELRYICGKSWDEIAAAMLCSIRYTHILHGAALNEVKKLRNATISL